MSQMNFEKFVGIKQKTEIQVASQPRADRVIPLIEKGILPRKEYWVWSKMEMTWSWDGFQVDKPLGRKIKEDVPSFQDHRATEKEFQIKIPRKFSKLI